MKKEIIEVAKTLGKTPSYIFDLDELRSHMSMLHKVFDGTANLCFAMKANPLLIEPMVSLVSKFEVCSPGEYRICQRAKIGMDNIVLSGINKERNDIAMAIQAYNGNGIFTVESLSQWELLQNLAEEAEKKIHVLLRITSGNQFGNDRETIRTMIGQREDFPNLHIKGLQFYSGTQKRKLTKLEDEIHMLDQFIKKLKTDFSYETEELEYGPGFYVPYFMGEAEVDKERALCEFRDILTHMNYKGNITLEMGRYMTASCGYYVTKVVDTKINNEQRFLILDGGIHHVNYYGQSMGMKIPEIYHISSQCTVDAPGVQMEKESWCACGSLCTSSDVIVRNLLLHNPQISDILIFRNTGAYSITEGLYLFLSRDLPEVCFYEAGIGLRTVRTMRHTDTINDVER